MRRPLLALLLLPLVTACARTSDLPPEVVMERTVQANRNLRSAHVEGTVNFGRMPFLPFSIDEGTVRFEGDLQDAGRQLALNLQMTGNHSESADNTITAAADLIVLDGSEVYVRPKEMDSDTELPVDDPAAQLSSMLAGSWWSVTPVSVSDETSVTPDPGFLRMQSEAVRVIRDNGIKNLNGRDVYLFDVQIDPEKMGTLLAERSSTGAVVAPVTPDADGTLWIDAETYFLHRARWTVRLADGGSLELNVSFSDHQEPVAISPPRDALPLPSNAYDLLEMLTGRQAPVEPDTIYLTD